MAPAAPDGTATARRQSAAKPAKPTVASDLDAAGEPPQEVPDAAREMAPVSEYGEYPYADRMGRREYEEQKARLQAELLKVQHWVQETGQKFVLLFEGRDAAGKGGTIKRFTEHLNPRQARVVALNKPTDEEKGQWFFQRYIEQLPTSGEIVFYDRSWYNRAGVELSLIHI